MNMTKAIPARTLLAFFLLLSTKGYAQQSDAPDYLADCLKKQVEPLRGGFLQLDYRENQNNLYHSPEPWQTIHYDRQGTVRCGGEMLFREDTIRQGERSFATTVQYTPSELLIRNYWSEKIGNVNRNRFSEYPLAAARYSPILLLAHVGKLRPAPEPEDDPEVAVYPITINESVVRLHIRKSDRLLERITTTWGDDMLGDRSETILYSDYRTLEGLHYPQRADVIKLPGDIRDAITLASPEIIPTLSPLLERPDGYMIEEEEEEKPESHVERISDHIYGINLPHTESRAFLVEFRDFFVAVDVPFNSRNGEMVLMRAGEIAPGKPVRYFAFGHHHPWYLGGVRPFIRRETTVICTKENLDYVGFVATAPHSINPDGLQVTPSPLKTELVDSIMTITDGEYEMKICHIGKRSAHTSDYLLFYFPSERMVMQGDLAWIPAEGPIGKASPRQTGLYNAIREFGLDVETVLQTWPIAEQYKVKATFPFSDLEESMGGE